MRINSFNPISKLNFLATKKTDETSQKIQLASENYVTSPVNPILYAAYKQVTFSGYSEDYDGTDFRTNLEKRAAISQTSMKLYPEVDMKQEENSCKFSWNWDKNEPSRDLKLLKTHHHEYVEYGDKLYKVRYESNKDRITQQIIASKLYEMLGVRTPEYIAFDKSGKTGWLVEVFEEKLSDTHPNKEALYDSFVADVFLGNRNGLSKGNTKFDENGTPVKMSVSGSLGYRASGKPKDKKFGYDISEIRTMRDPSVNPDAAHALMSMSDEDLYAAIKRVNKKFSYDTVKNLVGEYWPNDTVVYDILNVLDNRKYSLGDFETRNEKKKIFHKRGLDVEGTPGLTNLTKYDPKFHIDTESALKITDEQWQKLLDRDLFRAHYGLKKFNMLDYSYLAKMTDEEHENAFKRGLYAPRKSDEDAYDKIGGYDIAQLSKFTDEEWKNVEKRNLLDIEKNHDIVGCFVSEYIKDIVDISDRDWARVMSSRLMDSYWCESKDVNRLVEMLNEEDKNPKFKPSLTTRVRMLSNIEDGKSRLDKQYKAADILELVSVDNDKWDKIMEVTKSLTDPKMHPQCLKELINFDDDVYDTLRDRDLLTTTIGSGGLKELALLSDEDWKNVKKRKLDEIRPNCYSDWAYLAALSDEQWQTVLDRNLLKQRVENASTSTYDGDEISHLMSILDEKGWENYDKRGLYKDYRVFGGWGACSPDGFTATKLALLSDADFEKFHKLSMEHWPTYPETIFDLLSLDDIQYKRMNDRDLFKFQNMYEAYDNWMGDAPIIKALAELTDKEYEAFLAQKNDCQTVAAKVLILKADQLGLDKKHTLSELSHKEKRQYLQLLLEKQGIFMYSDFQKNYNCTEIVPRNLEEYTDMVNKLVKSAGIDVRPLDDAEKTKFFNAIDEVISPNSSLKKIDIKPEGFKLTLKYGREDFIKDIEQLVKSLSQAEKMKIWDYFGFELGHTKEGIITILGYPSVINNGEKLKEITNPETKEVIEKIRPYVKKFTVENKVLADGKFVSQENADTLNGILTGLSELFSIIGKEQHKTHSYTVDVHTLGVLQECIKNPEFQTLSKFEQRELILATLLHDITKEEGSIDKSHPKNSAFDAYFILEKFGFSQSEKLRIYQLVRHHDMLEQCNKRITPTGERRELTPDELDKAVKNYAYELRSGNMAKMMTILTKADLLSVTRDGGFYDKYGDTLKKVSQKLYAEVENVQKTSITLPCTKMPKASQLSTDGVNVVDKTTQDEQGNSIKNKVVYLSKGLNLAKFGFDKGVTSDNFNVIVHAFDNESQQAVLDALDFSEQEALLSASYVVYSKGNYHTFRPQGFILDVPDDNIGAAYYRDFGSGCKKTVQSLIKNYINGSALHYRKYIPEIMKKELKLSDKEYIKLYNKIKDKPLDVLERDYPEVAVAVKKIFEQMEVHKRKFQRNYNEILIGRYKPTAVFYVGKKNNNERYELEDVPEHLRKYAQDNDLPIIYFGE